jgi:hypothetical protein
MRKTKPNLGGLGYMGNSHRRVGPGSPGGETCETNPIWPRRQDAGRAWRRAALRAGATPDQVGGRLYEGPKRAKRSQFGPGSGVNAQNKPNLVTRESTLNGSVKWSYGRFACDVPRKNKANSSIVDCTHETPSHTSGCGGEVLLLPARRESVSWSGMTLLGLLSILGGLLFLASAGAHLYVRVRLRPGRDSDLDHCYYEFEDRHPGYARYNRWLQITLGAASLGILLLFLGIVF